MTEPQPAVLPADWCPGLPAEERLARLLLDQRMPEMCFHLVDDDEVRASLARIFAGHHLQHEIDRRDVLLEEETAVVHTVVGYLAEVTGLALAELECG